MSMARLTFYYGAMNAGKSLTLLAFAAKLRNKDIPYEVVKPSTDTRDGSFISSRPLDEKLRCYLWRPDASTLEELLSPNKMETTKYVLVDEAQFLTVEQVNYLAHLADRLDINVICYGLRTDFQTHLFEGSKRLFEIADELHEIEDIDAAGDKVIINARIKNGRLVVAGPRVVVGAEDKYLSMSRKEFYDRLSDQNQRQNDI